VTILKRSPGVWLEASVGPLLAVLLLWWAGEYWAPLDRPLVPFLLVGAYALLRRGAPVWIALVSTTVAVALRPLLPGRLPHPLADYLQRDLAFAVAFGLILYLLHRLSALTAVMRERTSSEADRFRMLLAGSPEGIWRIDAKGYTTEANRFMAEMLGYVPEEILGKHVSELVAPGAVATTQSALAEALRGEPAQLEIPMIRRDGESVHVLATTHPIVDAAGRFVETFAILRDISARHHVETERHQALSLLEAALESTADGILIVNAEGKIVRFNERFARMWRIPAEILRERDDARAIEFVLAQLEEPEQFLSKVRKLYATPEAESFDTLKFRDGRVFERYSLPQRLGGAVVGRVWSFRDVSDRERALAEQRLASEREGAIALNLDTALFTFALDPERRIIRYEYLSRGAEALYGIPARELEEDPNFWLRRVHPEDVQGIVMPAFEKLLRLQSIVIEFRYETSKGIWRWHRSRFTPRLEPDGGVYVDGIETDVTDRVALEEQFRHAQKLEAVGQLAGGVAHDFNNILTAVIGYADLLLSRMPKNDPDRSALEEIRKGGERAASLTRQLLAFSRRAATQPRVVDLNATIRDLEAMVRRLVGEDIRFEIVLSDAIGRIRVDPTQLEQVIVNLVVNARDAMPQGGTLSIRTDRLVVGEVSPWEHEIAPGAYARLRVADSGVGIPPAVLRHIFEPFFTTKEPGRGTGLGLATTYGIVRQHGGYVRAVSAPDQGAEFEILLPQVEGEPAAARPTTDEFPGGSEVVLVVEDDPSLLTLAQESLAELGYRVLAARRGSEALHVLERERGAVQLLVTDVVMPEMGGRELAERALRVSPGLPVLYVSGYAPDPALVHEVEDAEVHFLEKPYTPLGLARKVREVLTGSGAKLAGRAGGRPL
jgi:PAS domain S-box-containing protein